MISLLTNAITHRSRSRPSRLDITLNCDILLHVLTLSDFLDATSLMATCKLLYHEGARTILMRPIKLNWDNKLDSFVSFLEAENGTRLRFLREFQLMYIFYPRPVAITRLAVAVQKTHNLERLQFWESEHILSQCADLRGTFASLTSLKSITMRNAGHLARDFLQAVPSRIVSLDITWLGWFGTPTPAAGLLFLSLKNFAESLEELKWETGSCARVPIVTARVPVVYPKLRRLTISCRDFLQLLSSCAIPNITHLSLLGSGLDHTVPLSLPDDHTESHSVLSHLTNFDGPICDLYNISQFTSYIPRLDLRRLRLQRRNVSEDWFVLQDVLLRARPVELAYQAWGSFSQDMKVLCGVDGGKDALTHLSLKLNVDSWKEPGADFDQALGDLTAWMLSIKRLRHLKLNLVVDMRYSDYPVSSTGGNRCRCEIAPQCWRLPWNRKVEQGWLAFDVGSFARSMIDEHTALERVEVILSRPQCGCQRSAITEGGEVMYSEIRGLAVRRR